MADTVLVVGAIAIYVSVMSVELVPATLNLLGELVLLIQPLYLLVELLGELGHSVSTPVWRGPASRWQLPR